MEDKVSKIEKNNIIHSILLCCVVLCCLGVHLLYTYITTRKSSSIICYQSLWSPMRYISQHELPHCSWLCITLLFCGTTNPNETTGAKIFTILLTYQLYWILKWTAIPSISTHTRAWIVVWESNIFSSHVDTSFYKQPVRNKSGWPPSNCVQRFTADSMMISCVLYLSFKRYLHLYKTSHIIHN